MPNRINFKIGRGEVLFANRLCQFSRFGRVPACGEDDEAAKTAHFLSGLSFKQLPCGPPLPNPACPLVGTIRPLPDLGSPQTHVSAIEQPYVTQNFVARLQKIERRGTDGVRRKREMVAKALKPFPVPKECNHNGSFRALKIDHRTAPDSSHPASLDHSSASHSNRTIATRHKENRYLMARLLPPLAALRVFEAAARHGNFTRAAEELGMTQASVSYQIKVLEERIGAPLFVRRARDVALTGAGQLLAPVATDAFDRLASAYAAARGGAAGVLTIGVQFTFANWLAMRLGAFQLSHPALAVRMITVKELADVGAGELDVSIYWGKGEWSGHVQQLLTPARFTPMLSPALLASVGGVSEPADLLKLSLIDPSDYWWDIWFAAAGINHPGRQSTAPARYGNQALESRAAVAGHGVGILTPFVVADEIAAGRLVQPFDLVCEDGNGYWLAVSEGRRTAPKVKAFRDWLIAEVVKATVISA